MFLIEKPKQDVEHLEQFQATFHQIDEVLRLYALYLGKKADAKRMTYVKAFLIFCSHHHLSVSKGAIVSFMKSRNLRNASIESILNVFRKYCQQQHLLGFWQKAHSAKDNQGNALVLRFLWQYGFKNKNTQKLYQNELNLFINYSQGYEFAFGQIALENYLQDALNKGISVFTLNTRLSIIKSFVKWLLSQQDLCQQLTATQIAHISNILHIKSFRIDTQRYYKESLSLRERNELMNNIENIKEKSIIALQVYEGLRAKEVCNLSREDLDFTNNTILVLGKGKYKKEKIRLFEQSKKILEQYLSFSEHLPEGSLFGVGYTDVYKIVKKYLPAYSPHCLRHTAAQVMLEQGIEAIFVQKQMRHKNYQTTQLYTQKIMEKIFLEKFPTSI